MGTAASGFLPDRHHDVCVGRSLPHYPRPTIVWIRRNRIQSRFVGHDHHGVRAGNDPILRTTFTSAEWLGIACASVALQHVRVTATLSCAVFAMLPVVAPRLSHFTPPARFFPH